MSDVITLRIPAKADYLLTVRLSASSIGARMEFDVNDIEDIKTATAEACLIIMQAGNSAALEIVFEISQKKLRVSVSSVAGQSPKIEQISEESTWGKYLLEALSDEVTFKSTNDIIESVTFSKNIAGQ